MVVVLVVGAAVVVVLVVGVQWYWYWWGFKWWQYSPPAPTQRGAARPFATPKGRARRPAMHFSRASAKNYK